VLPTTEMPKSMSDYEIRHEVLDGLIIEIYDGV
jgi:hypothetical protein